MGNVGAEDSGFVDLTSVPGRANVNQTGSDMAFDGSRLPVIPQAPSPGT